MISSGPTQPALFVPPARRGNTRLGILAGNKATDQLRSSKLFVDYRDAFEATTGLPLDLVSLDGSPRDGAMVEGPRVFCHRMGDQFGVCPACSEWRLRFAGGEKNGTFQFEAQTGHIFTSIEIKADARPVGYFHTGHVFLRQPSQGRIFAHCGGSECQQLKDTYLQTRVISKPGYDSCIQLLGLFATHLSSACNQIVVDQAHDEPESVTRARAFIATNKHRPLSFSEVAAAVHVSAFHFCRVFRRATGLTFGNYVALVRIQDAKVRLQNPHTHVSEAAFAVGFQSIAQFNRKFRQFTGESPSEYRSTLCSAGVAAP